MGYHVAVDDLRCGGHGECMLAAPGVFGFDGESDVVSVLVSELTTDEAEAARSAESRCPNSAIVIRTGASR